MYGDVGISIAEQQKVKKQGRDNSINQFCIDPLHLHHVIRGISVYYLEAAILEYRNTLASYAVLIETCPTCTSLVSIYRALIAYISIFNSTHARSIVGA